MAPVRCCWPLSCWGGIYQTVVAILDVRMPFVTREQQEGMSLSVAIRRRNTDWHAQSTNLTTIIDSHGIYQSEPGVLRNQRVQVHDRAVFPEKCVPGVVIAGHRNASD